MNAPIANPLPPYKHTPLFPLGKDTTTYRKISADGVRVETIMGREMLVVSREAMRALARPRSPTSIICCARRISPRSSPSSRTRRRATTTSSSPTTS